MKRIPLTALAALVAVCAMIVTVWLSSPGVDQPATGRSNGQRSRQGSGFRTSRIAFVAPQLAEEQIAHPRIVALAPGVAQIVRDLHMGHLLVGRHSSDEWSDPRLSICGDQNGLDYERLIAVNPTHIFLQWGENKLPERLTSLAAEKGWVVKNVPLLKLSDIRNAVIEVYDATSPQELGALRWERAHTYVSPESSKPGGPSREREKLVANAPYTLLQRFEAAIRADEALAGAGRVLLLYRGEGEQGGSGGHPAALGPGSYHHDLLLAMGGRSAIDQGKPFMPLDAEDISRLKPEAIMIVRPRQGTPKGSESKSVEELAATLGVLAELDIPAVKNRRIALVDDPMGLVPGTNLSSVADQMRTILGGWSRPAALPGPARKAPNE